jgi:hypothetical protein
MFFTFSFGIGFFFFFLKINCFVFSYFAFINCVILLKYRTGATFENLIFYLLLSIEKNIIKNE